MVSRAVGRARCARDARALLAVRDETLAPERWAEWGVRRHSGGGGSGGGGEGGGGGGGGGGGDGHRHRLPRLRRPCCIVLGEERSGRDLPEADPDAVPLPSPQQQRAPRTHDTRV
eukprot:scaffold26084_cov55-Phaeocystis_antarctica.AAC.1